jgi:hypothetical protein
MSDSFTVYLDESATRHWDNHSSASPIDHSTDDACANTTANIDWHQSRYHIIYECWWWRFFIDDNRIGSKCNR